MSTLFIWSKRWRDDDDGDDVCESFFFTPKSEAHNLPLSRRHIHFEFNLSRMIRVVVWSFPSAQASHIIYAHTTEELRFMSNNKTFIIITCLYPFTMRELSERTREERKSSSKYCWQENICSKHFYVDTSLSSIQSFFTMLYCSTFHHNDMKAWSVFECDICVWLCDVIMSSMCILRFKQCFSIDFPCNLSGLLAQSFWLFTTILSHIWHMSEADNSQQIVNIIWTRFKSIWPPQFEVQRCL